MTRTGIPAGHGRPTRPLDVDYPILWAPLLDPTLRRGPRERDLEIQLDQGGDVDRPKECATAPERDSLSGLVSRPDRIRRVYEPGASLQP